MVSFLIILPVVYEYCTLVCIVEMTANKIAEEVFLYFSTAKLASGCDCTMSLFIGA